MGNELIKISKEDKELRINSVELVKIINQFREIESRTLGKECKVLQHKDFIKKIRTELQTLKTLGLGGERNISQSSYTNSQNKEQPCYSLNRDGMLQILNSESVLVRYKTIEYINELESKMTQPKLPVTYKEALIALVVAEEEKERLQLENKQLEDEVIHKENVIIGLVQDISVAEKRQRISMIVKHNCKGKFQDRYRLLYNEFDKKFHIDTSKRLKNSIEKGIVKKSVNRMAYICEHMNMTNELYDICCKIFSNDVQQLMNEMWDCIA